MMGGNGQYHSALVTCAAPSALPGARVTVALGDMGMTRVMGGTAPMGAHMRLRVSPSSVPAGQVSIVAVNLGWRRHEMVVMQLGAGAAVGQRVPGADGRVDETGILGEASTPCGADGGDGIESGAVSWTTVTLAPGRYEVICNLANHYTDGMYAELDVT